MSTSPYGTSHSRRMLTLIAIGFAVAIALAGLMMVAFYVFILAGMSHFGSNK